MSAPAFAASAAASTAPGVTAGYSHTCAIAVDGALSCWGGNYSGQLGDGTTMNRTTPVRVGEGSWVVIEAGTSYTCAIRTGGTLWCWGSNMQGQLGDGSTTSRTAPVQVGDAATWATVSAG